MTTQTFSSPRLAWLPPGKRAAVCFSIDDVHPGTSASHYEAGGDLGRGALGHVQWLLERHPQLRVTLFTTPDWREIAPRPTRTVLARVPYLRDRVYLSKIRERSEMRLDRHPAFVAYLRQLPRTEIGLHGLYHVHRGRMVHVEFQEQSTRECRLMLEEALRVFRDAGLEVAPGLAPPGWNAPAPLLQAMGDLGLKFVASSRDILTSVSPEATASMSGLKGVSLIYPERVAGGRLVHFTSNFQATSSIDRAFAIVDAGGLIAIKAHIIKNAMGHIALDGMDELYRNYLDVLFRELDRRYGETLWWTSMGAMAESISVSSLEGDAAPLAAQESRLVS